MLAQREYLNISDDDKLIVVLVKHGTVYNFAQILLVSLCEEQHCLGISLWCLQKPFTIRVFSKAFQNGANSARELCKPLLLLLIVGFEPFTSTPTYELYVNMRNQHVLVGADCLLGQLNPSKSMVGC